MTPPDSIPEPQDEAIGGLIETWLAELKASAEMPDEGEFGKGSRYQLTASGRDARELARQRLTALSRLQVERNNWRMEYLEAVRGEEAAWAENDKLKQQLTSSQSQTSADEGPTASLAQAQSFAGKEG